VQVVHLAISARYDDRGTSGTVPERGVGGTAEETGWTTDRVPDGFKNLVIALFGVSE